MRALFDGKIKSIGRASGMRGLSAFLVSKADVEFAIADASHLPEDGMTAQVVAQQLLVKEDVAYQLIGAGLLKSFEFHLNGRSIRLVLVAALQEFRDSYYPLINFARWRTTSSSSAFRWLASNGIHPVTGPSVDGLRQYFYRSSDIAIATRWVLLERYGNGKEHEKQ
jgi:hypothetical protein